MYPRSILDGSRSKPDSPFSVTRYVISQNRRRYTDHCKIDKYALSAHQSINEWAADHVSHVRQLKDTQFQIEGQIAEEREEEGNMLAGELWSSHHEYFD